MLRGEIHTATTQTFRQAVLVTGKLIQIDEGTIEIKLGDEDEEGNFIPQRDGNGIPTGIINIIDLQPGQKVNPRHLGTVYELRVIDGKLDPSHDLG